MSLAVLANNEDKFYDLKFEFLERGKLKWNAQFRLLPIV